MTKKTLRKADSNVAVHFRSSDLDLYSCSCGYKSEDYTSVIEKCPKCRTKDRITIFDKEKKQYTVPFSRPSLEVIEVTDKSFHLKKTETSVVFNPLTQKTIHKIDREFEMKWSLINGTLEFYRDDKFVSSGEYIPFFKYLGHENVVSMIKTENNASLIDFAFKEFGKTGYERSYHIDRALLRLQKRFPTAEKFAFYGFSERALEIVYNNFVIGKEEKDGEKMHQILGVRKYMLPYIKQLESFDGWTLNRWNKLDTEFGGNNVKTILEMLSQHGKVSTLNWLAESYISLVKTYEYRNHERLIKYLVSDLKLQQGISEPDEGARLLVDYVKMCRSIGINPEKYPRSLKKDHDIANMNYRMMNNEFKQKRFKERMNENGIDSLMYKNRDFTIVKPKEPQDLIDEGKSLGHCVASYVDDVISGLCKILFLRKAGFESEGLVTIEIRGGRKGSKHSIVQVRGRGNRNPTTYEKEFIYKWAEARDLRIACSQLQ